MKVKIINAEFKSLWYANKIGEVFEVIDNGGKYYNLVNADRCINKKSAEVVENEFEEIQDCCNCNNKNIKRDKYPCCECTEYHDDGNKNHWAEEIHKSCDNCKFNKVDLCANPITCDINASGWAPIENKSCATCKYCHDDECLADDCNNFSGWVSKPTKSNTGAPPLKKVYIAHPLTTHGNIATNIKSATEICRKLSEEGRVIPFSPLHAFGFYNPHGDQGLVMEYCYALLKSCDELWLHGDWKNSKGCMAELVFATEHGIPVRVATHEP